MEVKLLNTILLEKLLNTLFYKQQAHSDLARTDFAFLRYQNKLKIFNKKNFLQLNIQTNHI
jgi:hypothetical protein